MLRLITSIPSKKQIERRYDASWLPFHGIKVDAEFVKERSYNWRSHRGMSQSAIM